MQTIEKKDYLRVMDANFNRLKEGLRVCEDVARFVHNNESATAQLKDIRHKVTQLLGEATIEGMIESRAIEFDVGRQNGPDEMLRSNINEIFLANAQRVKESLRVLEEFTKLIDAQAASGLKNLRYTFYKMEQDIVKEL